MLGEITIPGQASHEAGPLPTLFCILALIPCPDVGCNVPFLLNGWPDHAHTCDNKSCLLINESYIISKAKEEREGGLEVKNGREGGEKENQ